MKDFHFNTKIIVSFFVIAFLLVIIPVTVLNALHRTSLTGQANTIASPVCGNAPADYILIIDRSNSMNGTKLTDAKTAAKDFIGIIGKDTRNRVGLVTFAPKATLDSPLTTNYSSVTTAIDGITTAFGTNMEDAVIVANKAFASDTTSNKKVAIFLTDGLANFVNDATGKPMQVTNAIAEADAITEIKNGYTANNAPYYTIGLGSGVNTSFLQQIASVTGASYYFAPTSSDLTSIYAQISNIAGKGSIAGFVFNDANDNHSYDTGESKLSLWTVIAQNSSGQSIGSVLSDNSGNYSFTGLCDGSYEISEQVQVGWSITKPRTPGTYSVAITNGSAVANKTFGNFLSGTVTGGPTITPSTPNPTITPTRVPSGKPTPTQNPNATPTLTLMPTPTIIPGDTAVNAKVFLDGRGNAGDSENHKGGNINVLHPEQTLDVSIIGANNQIVASGSGIVTINGAIGNFQGTIDVGVVKSDVYNIRLHVAHYLTALIPGIQVTSGIKAQLPAMYLIAGDMNDDNQLDIEDYNLFIGCYTGDSTQESASIALPNCTVDQKAAADINDDGTVNIIDYNYFERENAVRKGQ